MKTQYIVGGALAVSAIVILIVKSRGNNNSVGDTNVSLGNAGELQTDSSGGGLNLSQALNTDEIKKLTIALQEKIADANLGLGGKALDASLIIDLARNLQNSNRSVAVSRDSEGNVSGVSKVVLAGQKAYEDAKKQYANRTVAFKTQITEKLGKIASNETTIKSLQVKLAAPRLSAKSKATLQKQIGKLTADNSGFRAAIGGIEAQIKVLSDGLKSLSNISDFTTITGEQSSIVQT